MGARGHNQSSGGRRRPARGNSAARPDPRRAPGTLRGGRRSSRASVASDKVDAAATGAVLLAVAGASPMHSRLAVTVALASLGKDQADRDVGACRQMANEYVSN